MYHDFRDPSYIYKDENGKLSSSLPLTAISNLCIQCGVRNDILLNRKDYEAWSGKNGSKKKMVQEVFTWLNVNQIEILVTGIHSNCWDEIFKNTR